VTLGTSLATVFRTGLPDETQGALTDDARLEANLRAYVSAARAAQPGIEVDDDELVRYLAARSPDGAVPPLAHAGDLLLAGACARGVPAAIERFCDAHRNVIRRVLSRRRATTDLVDDATQAVYERLLVAASGDAPKIAAYKGTGPLRSWVSTTTATTLLMMQRAAGRRREDHQDSDLIAVVKDADPELQYLKERYKVEMEEAFVRALGGLGDRERTLLRLHLGERMNVDQIGSMYQVDRATAARWLRRARASLLEATRQEIRARLRLSDSECDSIVALVQSQLDVSIVRHLA
jgi:RNA polymerase sigma-70 factor (ECF subfamily)